MKTWTLHLVLGISLVAGSLLLPEASSSEAAIRFGKDKRAVTSWGKYFEKVSAAVKKYNKNKGKIDDLNSKKKRYQTLKGKVQLARLKKSLQQYKAKQKRLRAQLKSYALKMKRLEAQMGKSKLAKAKAQKAEAVGLKKGKGGKPTVAAKKKCDKACRKFRRMQRRMKRLSKKFGWQY